MNTEYRIEFLSGRPRPGDLADQPWERLQKEGAIDYRNLQQVVNEAEEIDAAWDRMWSHRVVEVDETTGRIIKVIWSRVAGEPNMFMGVA